MLYLFTLLGCSALFAPTSADAAIVVIQHHEETISLSASAGDVRVPTDTVVRKLTSDPVPTWTCNDPLGKASVDLGTPVQESGYLFYEEVDVPIKTDNVPRAFQCVIKNGAGQVVETFEVNID